MIPSLNHVLEALANPAGRFRKLKGICAVTNAKGDPFISTSSVSAKVLVEWGGRKHILYVAGDSSSSVLLRAVLLASSLKCRHLAPSSYFEKELYLFGSTGSGNWYDVALQEIPRGEPLADYIALHAAAGDREPLSKLYNNFCSLVSELSSAGLLHRKIRASSIVVAEGAMPILTDNDRMELSDDLSADNIPIAHTALRIYLSACRPDLAGTLLKTNDPDSNAGLFTRSAVAPLAELTETIASGGEQLGDRRWLENILLNLREHIAPLSELSVLAPNDGGGDFIEESGAVSDTLKRVMNGGQWRYADHNGGEAFEGQFRHAEDFFEGRAVVCNETGCGLIDRQGRAVLPFEFDEVRWYGREGVAIAVSDGRHMLCDRTGQRLSGEQWDWLGEPSENLIAAELNGKFGYIDIKGATAIPFTFSNAYDFRDGKAIVEIDGHETTINRHGNI